MGFNVELYDLVKKKKKRSLICVVIGKYLFLCGIYRIICIRRKGKF